MQATLATAFSVEGPGLHSGRSARVCVEPAAAGHGIRFVRQADTAESEVAAIWSNRQPAILCSAVGLPGAKPIRTIEHLMASFAALAIDNALVRIEGDELPIFDGSAVRWCHNILRAGLVSQDAPRRYIRILHPVEVREPSGHFLRVEPAKMSDACTFDIRLSFANCGEMRWEGRPSPWVFLNDIAPSRSFGLLTWGLPLKLFHLVSRKSLLRGANIFSTGIVWRGRYIGGMRVEDEPVRHRVLDLMGDMALAGAPLIAHVTGFTPRHELNHKLVRAIMVDRAAWSYAEIDSDAPTTSRIDHCS